MSYVIVDNNAGRGVPPCHFPEFCWDNGTPFRHRPEEYDGAGDVKLCCTQHVHATEYQQKKLTDVHLPSFHAAGGLSPTPFNTGTEKRQSHTALPLSGYTIFLRSCGSDASFWSAK